MRNIITIGQSILVTEAFFKAHTEIDFSKLRKPLLVGDDLEIGYSGDIYNEDGNIIVTSWGHNFRSSITPELYDDMRDQWRQKHGYTGTMVSIVVSCAFSEAKVYLVYRPDAAKLLTKIRKEHFELTREQLENESDDPITLDTDEKFTQAIDDYYYIQLEMNSNPTFIEVVEIENYAEWSKGQ